ncbi:MAG: AAA family ATPase [Desulfobacteraceae bacterium]|nr:AAA family ATPase [Desulfobacteraceae bacterium]
MFNTKKIPLKENCITKTNLEQFLTISINAAAALHAVHDCGKLHLGVSPASIETDEKTGCVKLIKCKKLIKDGQLIDNFDPDNPIQSDIHHADLMGTLLPFISPEQTGRVGWQSDHRSDLYSLGIVLYYWSTGVYPFLADNVMDYFYCHIAIDPPGPDILNQQIPVQLSKIIMQLLNKSPEERYQSALSLKKDFEKCLELLDKSGQIETFVPGEFDFSFSFRIRDKLYGRAREMDTLLKCYDFIKQGQGKTIVIAGNSGVGKTSLVKKFIKVNSNKFDTDFTPMFISGKFDSLGSDKPYHAVAMALQQMAQQILAKDSEAIDLWKKYLKAGLSNRGEIIVEMVTEFKSLTEPMPALPKLGSLEAEIRFNITFSHFLKNMCRPKYPLIIFLDDLQWADDASIQLLTMLKQNPIPWLFIICTYRANEVTPDHSPYIFIQKFKKDSEKIILDSLDVKEITHMIVDAGHMGNSQASTLAMLVMKKTQGNPFFTINFLKHLYKSRLLAFNFKQADWLFDIQKIESLNVTDNVATQIKEQFFNLTDAQKTILNITSCMAGEIDKALLSKVYLKEEREISIELKLLAGHGFLITENDKWFFSHDKIKEDIYSFLKESNRSQIHYNIGQALLISRSDNDLFKIVYHMNNGVDLITSYVKRVQLASLSLKAGLLSKERAAFDSAFSFAKKGLNLLAADSWNSESELTLALNFLSGETGYHAKNMSTADKSLNEIKNNAPDIADRVQSYKITMANLINNGDHQQAFTCGLKALSMLGMTLPEKIAPWMIAKEFILIKFYLMGKHPEDLLDLPKLSDPKKIMAIEILSEFFQALSHFHDAPEYIFYLVLKIINITMKYGETNLSGYAYAVYGAVLCQKPHNADLGYRFGRIALKIHEKPDTIKTKAKTYVFFGGMINHWKNHMRTDSPLLLEAYRAGMKNGNDLMFAAIAIAVYLTQLLASGKPLFKVIAEHKRYEDTFKKTNLAYAMDMYNISYQGLLNLSGKADDPLILKGEWFDETNESDRLWQKTDKNLIWFHFLKLFIEYLLYDFQKAVKSSKKGIKLLKKAGGMLLNSYYPFLQSLSMLALVPGLDKRSQKRYLVQIKKNQKNLKTMAKHSPDNFFSMYALVQAELAGLKGQTEKASDLYDQAIKSAKKHRFLHIEAIANECAGKFFLNRQKKTIAASYMTEAYNCFNKWGAKPKLKHLKNLYSDLLTKPETTGTITEPDLISIIKASQTIAEKTDLQTLMGKLMEIVIKNAGARQGFLIVIQDGQAIVKAKVAANSYDQSEVTPVPVKKCQDLPDTVINYVIHSKKTIILSNAENDRLFSSDEHIKLKRVKSILCIPMIHEGLIAGALYLENRLAANVFTKERVDILKMVTDILTNVWTRRKAQDELLQYQEQLRALSAQIALSEEKQRHSIALGLHDQAGQALALTRIKLNEISDSAASKDIKGKLAMVTGIVDQTIEQIRNLTFDLSPPELYEFGIETTLDSLCERKSKLYNIPINFFDDEKSKPMDETGCILIYQAARELLFNVIKHANATKIEVFTKKNKNNIEVIVKDNGIGFDTAQMHLSGKTNKGFGLFSIQERIHHHGGNFHIESTPGNGTKAVLTTPLKYKKS